MTTIKELTKELAKKMAERNQRIVRKAIFPPYETVRDIGEGEGLSQERVRQILESLGVKPVLTKEKELKWRQRISKAKLGKKIKTKKLV